MTHSVADSILLMNLSVTQFGQVLDPSKYTWDESTNTFSTNESNLVLDFLGIEGVTFKTGTDCTFNTSFGCTFNTSFGCNFNTSYNCTFKTGYGCNFNTGSNCTFNTSFDCTFKTDTGCTFNTSFGCTFNTGYVCTFNTGDGCNFNTGDGCTFKTGDCCNIGVYQNIKSIKCESDCIVIIRGLDKNYKKMNKKESLLNIRSDDSIIRTMAYCKLNKIDCIIKHSI